MWTRTISSSPVRPAVDSRVGDPGDAHPVLLVRDVIDETSDARSIVLEVPEGGHDAFSYSAGQFLTFRIPSEQTGSVARSYSLSSAPGIDEHLKVTVKRTAGGYGSNWLCDNIAPGDGVVVLPPSGRFTPKSLDGDLLLLAAGSGITPVMSILKTAMKCGSGRVRLFYANRDADAVIFDAELQDLQRQYRARLVVEHWLDDRSGHPDSEVVRRTAEALPHGDAFVCGPAPFMDLVARGLAAAGFERARVHRETFSSLSGNPFAETAPHVGDVASGKPIGAEGAVGGGAAAVVHLEGRVHEFTWARDRSLVDALLERGVDVPHSCRSGECGSCACTILTGEVRMENSEILDPQDVEDGYFLGCQARPVSDSVEVEF